VKKQNEFRMRIIFLTLARENRSAIEDFIDKESKNTTYFALGSVLKFSRGIKFDVASIQTFLRKNQNIVEDNQYYGQVIFSQKMPIQRNLGKVQIYYQLEDDIGFLQYQHLNFGDNSLWIGNVHARLNRGINLIQRPG